MITQVLHCPYCQGVDTVKNGKTIQGRQRYQCREDPCSGRTFILDYAAVCGLIASVRFFQQNYE